MRAPTRAPNHQPVADGLVARVATVMLVAGFVVMLPGGLYRFMLPKLLVVAVAVLLAALSPPKGRLPRSVAWAVAACGVVLVATTLTSAAPLAQAVGRWPRYEGLVALPLYAGATWAGARLLGPRCPRGRRRLALTAAAWASLGLAVVSVAEVAGLRPLGGDVARPGALLGNASDQGTVAAMLLGLLGATVTRAHPLLGAGAVAAGVSVVASGSRAGLGAALVALVVVGVGRMIAQPGQRTRMVAAVAGAAVALVAGALALPTTSQRLTGADDLAAASAEGRGLVWETAVGVVSARPWTGTGPSGFVDEATRHLPETWWDRQDPTMALDSPHSVVLQVAVAGGVPLLATTLALGAAVVWQARRRWQTTTPEERPAWWGTTAALSAAVVALSVGFTSAATVPLAAALLGWLVADQPPTPGHSRTGAPDPPGRWAWTQLANRPRQAETYPSRPRVGDRRTGDRASARSDLVRLAWAATSGMLVLVIVPAVAAEVPLARAQAAAVRGDAAATEQALRTAQRLRPWDADIDLLGACMLAPLALGGDRAAAKGAVDHARRALTRLPDSTETLRCQAVGSLGLGDLPRARTQLDRALVLAPDNPELLLLSGYTYAASGRLAQAVPPLQAATASSYTAQRAWSLLAQVYDELGEPEAADRASRLATDPPDR